MCRYSVCLPFCVQVLSMDDTNHSDAFSLRWPLIPERITYLFVCGGVREIHVRLASSQSYTNSFASEQAYCTPTWHWLQNSLIALLHGIGFRTVLLHSYMALASEQSYCTPTWHWLQNSLIALLHGIGFRTVLLHSYMAFALILNSLKLILPTASFNK